jgi:hypothetical protein
MPSSSQRKSSTNESISSKTQGIRYAYPKPMTDMGVDNHTTNHVTYVVRRYGERTA